MKRGTGCSIGGAVVLFAAAVHAADPPARTPVDRIRPDEKPIALVQQQPVYADQLDPPEWLHNRKRADLDAADFSRWLHLYRASRLSELVLRPLATDFIETHALQPTEAELQAFRDATARARPTAPGPEGAQGPSQSDPTPWVQSWKFNRALYEKYGGRIAMENRGPEPIDAHRKFLKEQRANEAFRIYDTALADSFWNYYTNDLLHAYYPGDMGRNFMETPWWVTPASPDPAP